MERINRDAYEVSGTDLEGFKEAVKKNVCNYSL